MPKDIHDLEIYQIALDLADEVWSEVDEWEGFAKYSIGKQFVLASDSIAANISEGHGRCHYKDMINFLYYSRGFLQEANCWLSKAKSRSLISSNRYRIINASLEKLAPRFNAFINAIKKKRVTSISAS